MENYLSPSFCISAEIKEIADGVRILTCKICSLVKMTGIPLVCKGCVERYIITHMSVVDVNNIFFGIVNGGYTEGWATYSEMLSYYFAPIEKPQATLMQKNTSILLGLYALADMGIHYDGWIGKDEIVNFFYGVCIGDSIATEKCDRIKE